MLRLDRTDLLVTQALSQIKPESTTTYLGEGVTHPSAVTGGGDSAPVAQPPSGNVGVNDPSSNAANSHDNYWSEELEEDSSGSDYDMAQYDDDGGALFNEGGEILTPFDDAKTYDEDEARDEAE